MNRNEIRKIKKGISLIQLLLYKLDKSNNLNEVFNVRSSFYHIFFDNNRLDETFLMLFPVDEIEFLTQILDVIKSASSTGSKEILSSWGKVSFDHLVMGLNRIKELLNLALINSSCNVFYSWQSDTSNSTNRSFIESSINKAIKEIDILPLKIDSDTREIAGSPDISHTIIDKISMSFIFIADITFVMNNEHRKSPNPNVLYELGYAQGVLSEENIIMIFNLAYGDIAELPFDLRGKRVLTYNCPENISPDKKKMEKQELINKLKYHIELRCKTENGNL